jgi:hypothetical protein
MDNGWDYKFPLVIVQALEHIEMLLSDHAPIIFNH